MPASILSNLGFAGNIYTKADLAQRITRRRPRGSGSRSDLAQRLGEKLDALSLRRWKSACKGQRGPTPKQAAEMVATIAADVEKAQPRARERRIDVRDVFLACRTADATGSGYRDGGTVTANNYGYRWETSTVRAERAAVRGCDGAVVYTVRRSGKESCHYPAKWWQAVTVGTDVLRGGGAFALRRRHGWDCYTADGVKIGVAVPMPADLRNRFSSWEHGRDVAACQAEIAAKRIVLAAEQAEAARQAESARQAARDERRAKLLARIATRLTVTAADAKAVGACDAGIQAFAERHQLPLDSAVPLATVFRYSPTYAVAMARRVLAVAAK